MELTLTIDCGNSSVKASLFDREDPLHPLCTSVADALAEAIADVTSGIGSSSVGGAIYCSVAQSGESATPKELRGRFDKLIVLDADTPVPIGIDYADRSSLGVDRLAGAVGAATILPDQKVMVVDAGSAVTYDLVAPDGTFCGGIIAPGIGMRLRALHRFTARLPRLEVRDAVTAVPLPTIGRSTVDAMLLGAVRGALAEIEYYRSLWAPDAVILTGGHARLLAECIADETGGDLPTYICLEPNLVSIGLNRIFRYNEDN